MSSATRTRKNIKKIQALVPDALPALEPLEGYGSIVPLDILRRFHRMPEEELRGYPKLLEAHRLLKQENATAAGASTHGIIFPDPLFKGTVYLAQITFQIDATHSVEIDDASLATISQFLTLALPAISKYCTQYGSNSLQLSSQILKLTVQTPQAKYTDDTLRGWLEALVKTINKPQGQTCIVVFNPAGISNATLDSGDGGYHDHVTLFSIYPPVNETFTYCVTEINPVGLTVDDRAAKYSINLTHELAEMTVDPFNSHTNPEVCDCCGSNCKKEWRNFFANVPGGGFTYLGSANGAAPDGLTWDFFIAAISQPPYTGNCPAPDLGCNYAPSAVAGVGELFLYEQADGYAELYSVDVQGNIAIQTIYRGLRTTWSLIVPGPYTFKPAPSRNDLLFYSESQGRGEFYKTGLLGDMSQISVHTNWRTSWSIIVPGSFSTTGAKDLLFYEPSDGYGEFDATNGAGDLTLIGTQSGWRTTWANIVPGRFSNGPLTGLLFYSPSEGTGAFYATLGKGQISLLGSHTDWRKTWTIIVPGHFSNNVYTDLLFYSPSEGTGEFYSTDGKGGMTLLKSQTSFRGTWAAIVTGHFSNSPYDDLLFYSPSEGTGEFYSTDGHGNISLIKSHTDWRTTWSIVHAL